MTAYERLIGALRGHGSAVRSKGRSQAMAQCPAHGDSNPSLSLTAIEGSVLVSCHAGCATADVLAAVGLGLRDLYDDKRGATYRYDNGRIVHRTPEKRFWQDGNTATVELYHLGRLRAATDGRVLLVEGEKDVHAVEALDGIATTAPQGADHFALVDVEPLRGRQVVAVVDRDDNGAGDRWAASVAAKLTGVAAELRFVHAKVGKDAADHIAAGYGLDEFVPFEPPSLTPPSTPEAPFPVPDTRGEEQGNALYLDVAALLDGGIPDPPAPVLLRRTDGHALFYARQVNLIFGDPESGKTLVVQAAGAEALKAGRKVLFVDIDHNGPQAIISRFLDMDVPEAILRDPERFRYVEPEDREHLMAVVKDAKEWRPAVAIVDSIGELLPLLGLNSNSPDDFTLAHTATLKPLAQAGAAVLAVDHLPKNTESRAAGPTGTAAKRRAVGGVALRVTINEQFTPGRGGSAFLSVNKDRHGGLRRHCPAEGKEPSAGLFKLDSSDGIRWTVTAPQLGEAAAAVGVSVDDLTELDALDPPPSSVNDVKRRLRWGTSRAMAALAAWRSRSSGTPGERGTVGGDGVPRSSPPVWGTQERLPDVARRSCPACRFPLDDSLAAAGVTYHPTCQPEGEGAA